MLIDKIDNSIQTINARRSAQDRKISAENYTKALNQLQKTSGDLQTILDCIDLIETNQITSHHIINEDIRNSLRENINSCGEAIYRNELSIEMVKLIQEQVKTLTQLLNAEWKDASLKYSEKTVGYLSLICDLTDSPAQARKLIFSVNEICAAAPNKKSIKGLVDNVNAASKIVDAFSLSPQIELFLKKISNKQATLSDLTPTVLSWLKENRLMNKLKISF